MKYYKYNHPRATTKGVGTAGATWVFGPAMLKPLGQKCLFAPPPPPPPQ